MNGIVPGYIATDMYVRSSLLFGSHPSPLIFHPADHLSTFPPFHLFTTFLFLVDAGTRNYSRTQHAYARSLNASPPDGGASRAISQGLWCSWRAGRVSMCVESCWLLMGCVSLSFGIFMFYVVAMVGRLLRCHSLTNDRVDPVTPGLGGTRPHDDTATRRCDDLTTRPTTW